MKNDLACYVMVGLPAHGKSTFISEWIKLDNSDAVVVSNDYFVEEKAKELNTTYDAIWSEYIDTATKLADELFKTAIKNSSTIVIDKTNLTQKSRRKILSQLPKEYEKIAVEFLPMANRQIEKERIESREGKSIPEKILNEMRERFEIVSETEGFDKIWIINPYDLQLEAIKTLDKDKAV